MAVDTAPESVNLPVTGAAPGWLQRVFWANLIAQVAIIITGGIVRVTGSGLGCPTWPECVDGSLTPTANQAEGVHRLVEFGNRTLTGVLIVLAVTALVGVFVWRRNSGVRRPWVTWLAAVPLVGTLAQAVVGGITVLVDLHPMAVASHLLLSLVVVAACVALVQFAAEAVDPPGVAITRPTTRVLGNALIAVTAVIVVMGTVVTGSGPHAGDARTARLDLDPRLISWLHADVVLLFIGLLVGMLALLHVDTSSPHRPPPRVVGSGLRCPAGLHRLRAVLHGSALGTRHSAPARGLTGLGGRLAAAAESHAARLRPSAG
ncbi:MAG: COX15/CtaA family protein [Candidatus Nanopelagicales bacterium]